MTTDVPLSSKVNRQEWHEVLVKIVQDFLKKTQGFRNISDRTVKQKFVFHTNMVLGFSNTVCSSSINAGQAVLALKIHAIANVI